MNNLYKTFVIGDVHGANKALEEVLEKSNFDYDNDTLISLGDLCDGYSETPQVIETLMKIKNLVSIIGNHDSWLYDYLTKGINNIVWDMNGGRTTMNSFIKEGRVADKKYLNFLEKQVFYYIDDKNRLFIHAGWDYEVGFPRGAEISMEGGGSRGFSSCWNRQFFYDILNGYPHAINEAKAFHEIFIGHTPVKEVVNRNNVWNIDTGAGWGGKLTMMNVDTKEIIQSEETSFLYPEEKGRF